MTLKQIITPVGAAVGFLLMCGCDANSIANHLPASRALSNRNAAKGGVDYTAGPKATVWSYNTSTCRSSSSAGVTTVRAGNSSSNLGVVMTVKDSQLVMVSLDSPDGLLTYQAKDCSDSLATLTKSEGASGTIHFQCEMSGKSIEGQVIFNQCGE